MEKQKPWQLYLIIAVIVLTLYNILPTIFYYSKPLKEPINAVRAEHVSKGIVERVASLESDSKAWLESFCKLLGIKPASITLDDKDPRLFVVNFQNAQDAAMFKNFLPRAGSLIPFVPAQLELYPEAGKNNSNQVYVSRQIGVRLQDEDIEKLFHYTAKLNEDGTLADFFKQLVNDRAEQVALAFGGQSKNAQQISAINSASSSDTQYDDLAIGIAKEMIDIEKTFGKDSPIAKRYFASFTQTADNREGMMQRFATRLDGLKSKVQKQQDELKAEQKKAEEKQIPFDSGQQQLLSVLANQSQTLDAAAKLVRQNISDFNAGQTPLTSATIKPLLKDHAPAKPAIQIVSLQGRNPFIESIAINWDNDKISLRFYPDVQTIRLNEGKTETANYLKDKMNQLVINDIARASRLADETVLPEEDTFAINLNQLTNTQSLLALNLGYLAEKQSEHYISQINAGWQPASSDLQRKNYPILTHAAFKNLKPEEQKLGLIVYAPVMENASPPAGFRTDSIYIIARGMENVLSKAREMTESADRSALQTDIESLQSLMQTSGFIGYPGSSYGMAPEYAKDYIFELNDYYSTLLKATREDFAVKGSKRNAVLDFTDVEQRILTWNKIEDRIQEDLLKWKEEHSTAQVDINVTNRYLIPAPTKNPYWENFKLSFVKYFSGDERKILKWGLDLSGGKTVRIGLRDQNNREVTNPEELNQAVNELYTRVNKMGISERTIHIEDHNIVLDFPGSQGMSASDLVKASAMYFHIVNEKFSPQNPALKDSVNQFLQNVWNEAIVTNRKDVQSINEIAWLHLGGDSLGEGELRPLSEAAKTLYENGLRLANPNQSHADSSFNDTISSIGILRGDDYTAWNGQANPLAIIFHNYALEGASLTDIQVGYDPSEGNILSFHVKSSYEGSRSGSPRDDFYAWTSQFAEDKIIGTPNEAYTHGKGWKMAVILNGTIITEPALRAALRDSATISGRFSQREINQLAADLKAGSLSYTPRILSEENVSPELGREERKSGITASLVAIALVAIAMIGYYRFAGLVATCAVLLNILIMWGVFQNIGFALSLPGIAGVVLTIGMAVDANVLVFERIREEFGISGRISSAIQAGYRKAFSAIIDSNITTIIAALVLIQFDSGPIKGFAVALIIGILSSMFTALFMTRFFFAGWVQNPKNKSLTMSHFIGKTNIDFLGLSKAAITVSLIVMAIGTFLFISQGKTMFGMDFTGGYSLNVDLNEKQGTPSYRLEAMDALLAHGATKNDLQIRELSKPNQLRIQLGTSMEEKGHPFYQMPVSNSEGKYAHEYERNPRIVWLVNALADANLTIQKTELDGLDRHWNVISGQFSDAMRNNALFGLSIALISILVYITFRFEFKFAVGAVVGLAHDVIIALGILAFFHWIGMQVQIDLQVVGAIMTIIGYSLNDTIIVFDRIREDTKILRKMAFKDIVNHALNVTLSRTLMTSGTTLLVLFALVFLGGHSIFAFSLVMTIGVIVGTLSSLFIAAPVMLYVHNREVQHQQAEMNLKKA